MQKTLLQEEQTQDLNEMASWGKRKDGQSYRKDKKSGMKKTGSISAGSKKLKSNARKIKKLKNETVYVEMFDENGMDYEEEITLGDLAAFHYDRRVDNKNNTFSQILKIGSTERFGQSGRDVVEIVKAAEELFLTKYGADGYQKVMNQLVNELDTGTKVDPDVTNKAMTAKEKEDEMKKNYKSKNGFKNNQYMTAFEKDKVLDDWNQFLKSDFDPQFFTERLYEHLHLHASFIAHFNRGVFYNTYFQEPERTLGFLKQFDADGKMDSVEYGYDGWLSDSTAGDLNKGMIVAFTPLKKKIYLVLRNESLGEDEKRLLSMQDKVKKKRERFKKTYG